ncbi:MAG TPA: TetR family transcriptional regulator C-terminal domain-containing protein [Kaistiaceae bacterium]|nr:TetR family transcriptional regulator C-terminal domain-containing protein [Kaistiaceae bacterium]
MTSQAKIAMSERIERRNDADATRTRLLDVAFGEIYAHGFQGLRIDTLLDKAGLTKGAFYHHFSSKTALGLAVIDELLAGLADLVWGQHLAQYDDPLEGIEACIGFALGVLGDRATTFGCPINNLAQEMSAVDDAFRDRLGAVFRGILDHIAAALERGQANGIVRPDVDPRAAAIFILAGFEGMVGLAKSTRDPDMRDAAMGEARRYLESLRASG